MDKDSTIATGTEIKLAARTACNMKTPANSTLRSGSRKVSSVGSLGLEQVFTGDGVSQMRMQRATSPRIAVIMNTPDRLKVVSRIGPRTKATENAIPILMPIAAVIFVL